MVSQSNQDSHGGDVVALSGGVGGAKLALGLSKLLPSGKLFIAANTGDDFRHLNLHISPDLDTLTYTLADIANLETGWGRRDDTWSFMNALGELGGETWFKLGDRDLAMHVERTRRLAAGETLSQITRDITTRLGIRSRIVPMCDEVVSTRVVTTEGEMDFQRYFVELNCRPQVTGFVFHGAQNAKPQHELLQVLRNPSLRAIVICPSNPFISVDPILSVPGIREELRITRAPVIAVSPVIGGRAVKGPTAKMMSELGLRVDAASVARHYSGLIDGYVIDLVDRELAESIDLPTVTTATLMNTLDDRIALARSVLDFADRLGMADRSLARASRNE